MKRRTLWFGLIIGAQVIFLSAWAGYHEWVRLHAPVIRLSARPVDPQDLLRGDYLALAYDIGDVTLPAPATGRAAAFGGDVWVLLEARGRCYAAVQASRDPLAAGPGQILVRGTLARRWPGGRGETRVVYGIEHFFVAEGKGTPPAGTLEVEVSVSSAHRLYIRRVLVDGRAYP